MKKVADHLRTPPAVPEADYRCARVRRESALAAKAELALAQRAGELMATAAVRACLVDVAGEVRQALARLPAEIAEAVKPLAGDEDAILAEMQRRIDAALTRAADALEGRG